MKAGAGRAWMKAGAEGKEAAGPKHWTALKRDWYPDTGMAYPAN